MGNSIAAKIMYHDSRCDAPIEVVIPPSVKTIRNLKLFLSANNLMNNNTDSLLIKESGKSSCYLDDKSLSELAQQSIIYICPTAKSSSVTQELEQKITQLIEEVSALKTKE
ncbi:unnamed protein product [Medioppia subpectinata]|uniref:Uncharacterized protein n=1 Tax=Medioppia subpectinata TaxID=1979941 RepID=A0A7R9Q4P3_9ACAR|nr:unnamed protein product [Medioppia subpectinata]CAG2112528.1 unnamed protein product [Medioppia subpectinata]